MRDPTLSLSVYECVCAIIRINNCNRDDVHTCAPESSQEWELKMKIEID